MLPAHRSLYHCPRTGCNRWFSKQNGLTRHLRSGHHDRSASDSDSDSESDEASSSSSGNRSDDSELSSADDTDTLDHGMSIIDVLPYSDPPPSPATPAPTFEPAEPENNPIPFSPYEEMGEAGFSGVTEHENHSPAETPPGPQPPAVRHGREFHLHLNGIICNHAGEPITTPDSPAPPVNHTLQWHPFRNRVEFEVADFLYRQNQMSAGNIDVLMKLWEATLASCGDEPPFTTHRDLYRTIDDLSTGRTPWESFMVSYQGGDVLESTAPDLALPSWMATDHEIWYRDPRALIQDLIANPTFANEFDYIPYHDYHHGQHRFGDFMSGDWAWRQADKIYEDNPDTRGSFLVPIILGSDKTTVSVATGNNEYWPVYLSIGNIHNNVRRAHRNGVVVLAFLAIPKAEQRYAQDGTFRKFRRQLFHTSLAQILAPLLEGMSTPVVVRCGDGHFRRAIYCLGPYIADYPEQCLLSSVVQGWCPKCTAPPDELGSLTVTPRSQEHTATIAAELELWVAWDSYGVIADVVPFTEAFPRADIHELIAPDILHQLIKGTFKDHLVTWIEAYLVAIHGKTEVKVIISRIDRRIAVVPPFAGLRRFPQGRGFKQWTGSDSKALMKVYIPAIKGHCPSDMVRAIRAFLEFCYIVRRDVVDTNSLNEMQTALLRFHQFRKIFETTGIRKEDTHPPRQHSLIHYHRLIRDYGAPNGICSSITESRHITAIKKPWRRSNRYKALGQMLKTNQRLDRLAGARADFEARGMLKGSILDRSNREIGREKAPNNHDEDDPSDDDEFEVSGERTTPSITMASRALVPRLSEERGANASDIGKKIQHRHFVSLIIDFLRQQQLESSLPPPSDFDPSITTYPSVKAAFHAPSDISGTGGMRGERIRAVSTWRNYGVSRYDTVFIKLNNSGVGMCAFNVARVRLFFSFNYSAGARYQCALVDDYILASDGPDEVTGMWMVKRAIDHRSRQQISRVIHVEEIIRAAHLIPVFPNTGDIDQNISPDTALDHYRRNLFYVNKFVDYHAFETVY
ncbi:hypothetical protein JOM56_012795 [Amanita muscaria]